MAAGTLDAAWVKTRIGDELGLTDDDLARLYGVKAGALDRIRSAVRPEEIPPHQWERLVAEIQAQNAAKADEFGRSSRRS